MDNEKEALIFFKGNYIYFSRSAKTERLFKKIFDNKGKVYTLTMFIILGFCAIPIYFMTR